MTGEVGPTAADGDQATPRLGLFLGVVVASCLAHPVFSALGWMPALRVAWAALLVAGVLALQPRGRLQVAGLTLAAIAVAVQSVRTASAEAHGGVSGAAHAAHLACLALLGWAAARRTFRRGPVTLQTLSGAVALYLLLGLGFSQVHALVALVEPGTYSGLGPPGAGAEGDFGFVYYSFVTLTTLGFGDLLPTAPLARTVTWLEAAVGQVFLAVVIAALVSRWRRD